MKESIYNRLLQLAERHEELSGLLSDPMIIRDQNRFKTLSKEYSDMEMLIKTFLSYKAAVNNLHSLEQMQKDSDPEIRSLAEEELKSAKKEIQSLTDSLNILLLPKDPNDHRNVYLEIRAGTGGDEAAIFAGDLFRMYSRYAEKQGFKVELVSESFGEHGGYKEVIARIIGQNVFSLLKFESGVHRVQRVPQTESQGRIHTSACTVAVLPEVEEIDSVDIDPSTLRIDTYRASGAGGQHVNRTDSAVRITHLVSGIVVECQDERSQHKNKAKALNLLKAKLLAEEQRKQEAEQAETRRGLIGSGDRSERIRTYNYPQGRVTDHRINLTLYQLQDILEGDVDQLIVPLIREYQAEALAIIGRE